MAVFTPVEPDQLEHWLQHYDLGTVLQFRGISSGIENSNFFLTMQDEKGKHEYVLTLFERLTAEQLPFYLELMHHLADRGIACPAPLFNRNGQMLEHLNGKPAAIVTRLPGHSVTQPSAAHCAAVGKELARMHLAGTGFNLDQPNLRGLDWWQTTAPVVLPYLNPDQAALLTSEVEYQTEMSRQHGGELPWGPIHADLFRDNVLFEGSEEQPILGGLIDFYFAGCDIWLFDVAVCINDWCIDLKTGAIDGARYQSLLQAYAAVRSFTEPEKSAWPTMLRAAALRFWLSRLWDFHLPRPAEMLTPHDPTHFERILRLRRSDSEPHPLS